CDRLRYQRGDVAELAPSGRRRGRQPSRSDRRGRCRGAGVEEADPAARAGERGPPSGGGVSVAGESASRWLPKMTYPLVSELADAGIPVTVSCRVLKLAGQPYCRGRNEPVRDADMLRAYRINALHDAHHDDPTFGYRYLADEARRAGWRMSRRTAWKLCSQAGILSSAQRRRRGKGKKAGPPVFDDHVQRVFRADAPNRLWL